MKAANKPVYTQDRELSWLRFNERVLEEAEQRTVPLMERLKFIAIFTSNLDEFYMVRVGGLAALVAMKDKHRDVRSGMTPKEQLKSIVDATGKLIRKRDRIVARLERQLRRQGIVRAQMTELSESERRELNQIFNRELLPFLSPQIVDPTHPFPFLANKQLCLALLLKTGKKEERIGLIPLPETIRRVIFLPSSPLRYVLAEQLLLEYGGKVFSHAEVLSRAIICVTRSADINPDDEAFDLSGDYRKRMQAVLKRRSRLAPVRLEMEGIVSDRLSEPLRRQLGLSQQQVFHSRSPLTMDYVSVLENHEAIRQRSELFYPPFQPQLPGWYRPSISMIRKVLKEDVLLLYPYDSMEPFLKLIREAAVDPDVLSIQITIYRLSSRSRLVEALAGAAENGKDVLIIMELRARFDEANNINWSQTLIDAGCKVIYGIENYKVHSKICQIVRRGRSQSLQRITQIGTGNYNEKTSRLYTDCSLITSDPVIGQDAADFFRDLSVGNLQGEYRQLLASPHTLKPALLRLIDQQIQRQRSGQRARILIKVNSITDRQLIDKLSEASQAGVQIDLIVRGICCILPGVAGWTENVRVVSVVGRFLEHSRIYCFASTEETDQVYLSSADWMTRNTEHRAEIACPVHSAQLCRQLREILEMMLDDAAKGRQMLPDGSYARIPATTLPPLDSQQAMMEQAVERAGMLPRRFSVLHHLLQRD